MKMRELGRALVAVVVAQLLLAAATFAWVAVYSHWIAPGLPLERYSAHAALAGPWISLLIGVPVYDVVLRRLAHRPSLRPRRIALVAWSVAASLDLASVALADTSPPIHPALLAGILLAKATGCLLGSRAAHPNRP